MSLSMPGLPDESGRAAPGRAAPGEGAESAVPLVRARGLVREFVLPRTHLLRPAPRVRALDDVSFDLQAGRSLGVVGESGSGKSTLARLVMALDTPTAGTVELAGRDLARLSPEALRAARRDAQMVFQDPYGSLDPRQRVGRIVAEPLSVDPTVGAAERRERVAQTLASVGLRAADMARYPHEFSGGQRQRIAIARALLTRPRLIVADEPVSALDVSIQAQVLNLLSDLQAQHGVTYLLISHDLAVVHHVCDDVLVLYRGRVVERGEPSALFRAAAHPYTRALVDAVPTLDDPGPADSSVSTGPIDEPPAPGAASSAIGSTTPPLASHAAQAAILRDGDDEPVLPAGGCAYRGRCPYASEVCASEVPLLRDIGAGRQVACHHFERVIDG